MKKGNVATIIIGVFIGIVGFYVYVEFNGNPITMPTIRGNMIDYVQLTYPELQQESGVITYNFKDKSYRMKVDVKKSEDKDFYVEYINGEITDNRKESVFEGNNTADRFHMYLNEELSTTIIGNTFKESLSFVLFTPEEAYWNAHHPVLDTSIEDLLANYPLACSIYLEEDLTLSYEELQQLKVELISAYEKQGIHISDLTINHQ